MSRWIISAMVLLLRGYRCLRGNHGCKGRDGCDPPHGQDAAPRTTAVEQL